MSRQILVNGDFASGTSRWHCNGPVTTIATDNADFGAAAPSLLVTHVNNSDTWSGVWNGTWGVPAGEINYLMPGVRYEWSARIKGPAGLKLYALQNQYHKGTPGAYASPPQAYTITHFTCTGSWQTVSGSFDAISSVGLTPPVETICDVGFYFEDADPTYFQSTAGKSFRIDDFVLYEIEDSTLQNGDFSNATDHWAYNVRDTSLTLDNADFGAKAPSLVCTKTNSSDYWAGIWAILKLGSVWTYKWSARVKGPVGLQIYMQSNWYAQWGSDPHSWFGQQNSPLFALSGTWQTFSGEFTTIEGTTEGDWGIYFRDNDTTAVGKAFKLDDVKFDLVVPSLVIPVEEAPLHPPTPFQPPLPAESTFTDAEFSFMEESPPGLFPENQNSNFGTIIRMNFSNFIQELADDQMTLYNERFVDTSTLYLDQWELETGLPPNPTGIPVAQQRQSVLARLRRGPFTRSRRDDIIRQYIGATFGDPIILVPGGVAMDPAGVALHNEGGSVDSFFHVTENLTAFSYTVAISNAVTPNITSLTRELKRITPAGISFTITRY